MPAFYLHLRFLLSVFCFTVAYSSSAVDIYVSLQGNDTWTGKLPAPNPAKTDGPFATLERARNEIRQIKTSTTGLTEPVTVWVRGGTYCLSNTFTIEQRDSGTRTAPITYRAYQNEKPVILGGKPIAGFTAYKGNILKADVGAQGFKDIYFRQLIFDGKRQPLARYPNFDPQNPYYGGWAYADGKWVTMWTEVANEKKHTLQMKPGDVHNWAHPEEGEVFVFPRYNWWNNIVRIASVDSKQNMVTLGADCSYAIRPGDRYYIQNQFEELDAPGEWYLDKIKSILYFWPPTPLGDKPVYAPTLRTIINLTTGTAEVTLQGFVFECCEGTSIQMNKTTNCVVAGCTIRNVGDYNGSGVNINGGRHNGVVGCDSFQTGSDGIAISGGDQKTLSAARNYADNNSIDHPGIYYKQGVGIELKGVGNSATHNLIHDTPRMGILFWGNNHLIEYNHVHHANLETQDSGIIYTSGRDWLGGRGCEVRYNYFHDSGGYGQNTTNGAWEFFHNTVGIYLDDNAGGVDVIGNVVACCPGSLINLHNARDIRIENNILIDGEKCQISCYGWIVKSSQWTNYLPQMIKAYDSVANEPAWKNMRGMGLHPTNAVLSDGTVMSGNVFIRNIVSYEGNQSIYVLLNNVSLKNFLCDSNLVCHSIEPLITLEKNSVPFSKTSWKEWREAGMDTHSIIGLSGLERLASGSFVLDKNSSAWKLGFEPIPFEQIGPHMARAGGADVGQLQ